MDAARDKFYQEISNLEKLISFYTLENKLLGSFNTTPKTTEEKIILELSTELKSFRNPKRQFNYNSIIISLYGFFERFIENCLFTYADELNSLIEIYQNLPSPVKKKHLLLSLSLINKIEDSKYTGPLRKEEIIKNLHNCLNTPNKYKLNGNAFTQHSANFRLKIINDSFSQLGINQINSLVLKETSFREFIAQKLELQGSQLEQSNFEAVAFQTLNDLAEYRNQVAHGVEGHLIGNDILNDYLVFFKHYSYSLIEVLRKNLLHIELEQNGKKLGPITDSFRNGEILCFKSNKYSLKIGDNIIGTNSSTIVKASIQTIELNDTSVKIINSDNNYEIGVLFDNPMKRNFQLYLV
jgi:hypothetical protein